MNIKFTRRFPNRKYIVVLTTILICWFSQITFGQNSCSFGDPICHISPDTIMIEGCSPDDVPNVFFTEIEDVFSNLPTEPCGELAMINLGAFVDTIGNGCADNPYRVVHVYCLFDDLSTASGGGGDGEWQPNEPAIFGFQFFNVIDTTDPILTCPEDLSTACSIPAPYGSLTEFLDAGGIASDNCGLVEPSFQLQSQTSDGNTCPQIITRIYYVEDSCFNTMTCTQLITIDDEEVPEISAAPGSLDGTIMLTNSVGSCFDDLYNTISVTYDAPSNYAFVDLLTGESWSFPGPEATDNCTVFLNEVIVSDLTVNECNAELSLIWDYRDLCGNAITFNQMITVLDEALPILVTPAQDQSVNCNGSTSALDAWLSNNGGAFATDNCVLTWSNDFNGLSEECGGTGSTTVTFTADDGCGQSLSTTASFSITDLEGPILTCPPNQTLTCFENIPAPATTIAAFEALGGTVFEACSASEDLTIFHSQTDTNGNNCPGDARVHTRTYYVQDECGNQSSCTQTFTYLESFDGPAITSILPACYKYCGDLANPEETDVIYTTDCSIGATVDITGPEVIGQENCPGTIYRYTYTVTDDCGRTSAPVNRDFIIGNNGPTISCPPFNLILACGNPNNQDYIDTHIGLVTANSSCGQDATITYSPQDISLTSCATGTVVTFVATDACGRTASCTTTIAITDNDAPTITSVPPSVCDVTECGGDVDYWFNHWIEYMYNGLEAEDDCAAEVTWSTIPEIPVLNTNCNANGEATTIVTFVASDDCNNTATITGTFVVENDHPATFDNVPADEIISCLETPTFGPDPDILYPCQTTLTFTDVTNNNDPCAVTMTRTWIATDQCGGLTTSTSQTITIIDDESPSFTFIPADQTIACDAVPVYGIPIAIDECTSASLTHEDSSTGSNGCSGSYTRVWTATDDCGNITTASQTLTFTDNESPIFTSVPVDGVVECGTAPNFGTPVYTDNCNTVSITQSESQVGGSCSGSHTRTWTITDACGNSATASQTFSYNDNEAPTFSNVPADSNQECGTNISFGEPILTDNCNDVNLTHVDAASGGDCSGGTIVRTWTATDECGNSATASSTVFLFDGTPPVASNVPGPITISCEEDLEFGTEPTFTDNCDADVFISFVDFPTAGNCPNELVVERVWTGFDDCGNSSTASQMIYIIDETDPVFTFVEEDNTVSCGTIPSFAPAEATDNCSGAIITFEDVSGGSGCTTTITRTWLATDACGNSTSATTVLTFEDDEDPFFTFVPADENENCGTTVTFDDAIAQDNCSSVSIDYEDEENGSGCNITVVRTWTATDDCGNTATASATISLIDNEEPTFTFVPSNGTVECGSGNPDFDDAEATDNCGSVSIDYEDEENGSGCNITVVRTWTATDDCGNTATASATISLSDSEAPEFTFVPGILDVDCDENQDFIEPEAEDNCSAVTITFEDLSINGTLCDDGFAKSRLWTATDACGNTATVETTVWVNPDVDGPVWTFVPEIKDVDCDENTDFEFPEASDNCGSVVITWEEDVNGTLCDQGYAKVRLWTATDDCGNTSTVETTVWVNPDETAPVFSFVPSGGVLDCADYPPSMEDPEVSDACGSVAIELEEMFYGNSNGCQTGEEFEYHRVWTATDDCGNSTTASQVFIVSGDITNIPSGNISGVIQTVVGEPVAGVSVSLEGALLGINQNEETLEDGVYEFSNLPLNQNYTITPHLDTDPLNGISSFDLLLITKHILGISDLDSPYKRIAADVNKSGDISTLDILDLRKVVLHEDSTFMENTSWRFIAADYIFPEASNPFASIFPESNYINGLVSDETHNYVAIKTGDVNESAQPSGLLGGDDRDYHGAVSFRLKDKILEAEEIYDVTFKSSDFVEVAGYQFSLQFDTDLIEVMDVIPGDFPGMGYRNFGLSHADEGYITSSWHRGQALTLMDETPMFTLKVKVKETVDLAGLFQISSAYTKAEAYRKVELTGTLELHSVELRYDEAAAQAERYALYQNEPNPFHNKTSIGFQLPKDSEATIVIYDLTGRELYRITDDYDKGFHRVSIDKGNLESAAGLLYYQLITPKWRATKKMILAKW